MKFPEKSADIFQIDVKAMFEQAVREHIPFHEVNNDINILKHSQLISITYLSDRFPSISSSQS